MDQERLKASLRKAEENSMVEPEFPPEKEKPIPKRYLGDGVYADFDGYHIVLTAEDGVKAHDTIYLEAPVWDALCRYGREVFEGKR